MVCCWHCLPTEQAEKLHTEVMTTILKKKKAMTVRLWFVLTSWESIQTPKEVEMKSGNPKLKSSLFHPERGLFLATNHACRTQELLMFQNELLELRGML